MSVSEQENTVRFRESYMDRAIRKMKENPAVPIGALITAGCIVGASVRLLQGNSRSFNLWLRARVVSHFATTAAIAYGVYVIGQDNLERDKQRTTDRTDSVAGKERLEFEERMKKAEENHMVETEVMEMIQARKQRAAVSQETQGTPPSTATGSWRSWLGLSKSSPSNSSSTTPNDGKK